MIYSGFKFERDCFLDNTYEFLSNGEICLFLSVGKVELNFLVSSSFIKSSQKFFHQKKFVRFVPSAKSR